MRPFQRMRRCEARRVEPHRERACDQQRQREPEQLRQRAPVVDRAQPARDPRVQLGVRIDRLRAPRRVQRLDREQRAEPECARPRPQQEAEQRTGQQRPLATQREQHVQRDQRHRDHVRREPHAALHCREVKRATEREQGREREVLPWRARAAAQLAQFAQQHVEQRRP
jgi:hypothetical protein